MFMRLSVLTLLATAALVICMPLTAQEPRPFEKVSLRTDQALDIFLDVIRESKRNKDWPRALKALEEIERFIKTNGNEYILPVSDSLYTGARAAAYRELVTFPREALDAWRISADRAVCDAIEDCKLSPDASMLEKVVARYPLSSFGAEALDLLGAIYLERGDFSRLLRMCAKARVYLPGLEPAMKARLDLLGIISLTGLSGIRPDKLIEQFNKEFVRVKLPLHGTPVPAKQVLETCLTAIKPPETELPALPGGIGVEFWNKQFAPPANMEQLVRAAKNSIQNRYNIRTGHRGRQGAFFQRQPY